MCYPQRRYHVYAAGRNRQRAMDRFACYMDDKDFTFLEFDVTKPLEGDTPFHYIIDAASLSSPNFFKNHPVEVIRANINGVGNLLDYGVGHALRRLLYVSSGEVYGEEMVRFLPKKAAVSSIVPPLAPAIHQPSAPPKPFVWLMPKSITPTQ